MSRMPDLSYVHIRGLVLFQEIFRLKRRTVHAVNEKMRIIYSTLISVSNNINMNYVNDVITQENHREFMIKTQNALCRYKEIGKDGIFTIRTLSDDIRMKVSYLHYLTTELVKVCGCSSCYEIINLLIGTNWDLLFTETQKKQLQFYNTMFIPIQYRLDNTNGEHVVSVSRYNTYTHTPLLKLHGAEIHVPYGATDLIIKGYFRDDSLNMARHGEILGPKYKQVVAIMKDGIFYKRYLEQLPLRDFLCNDVSNLLVYFDKEAQEHKRLRDLPIGHVAEEFHNGNSSKQQHLLTLLLCDKTTYAHAKSIISVLLQNPTKVLSTIYQLLHWSIQGYFDEIARTVDTKDITEDESTVPYETRIENLKCSESIKRKAKDKLKEIRVAREGNDKAIKYLDGILQVPFGIYRKEKILRFMSEYQENINAMKCNIRDHLQHQNDEKLRNIKSILDLMHTENQINIGWDKLHKYTLKSNNTQWEYTTSILSQLDILATEWTTFKKARKEYLINVHETLNTCIYGQDDAKRKIESLIAQWINGQMSGCVFGFQGYPGTGKTTFAKQGLAKCLLDENGQSRPFFFIPLGGSNGGSLLEGHGYTYVGSHWGKIVDCLRESKIMNPIIYFDELDKVSGTPRGEEIIRILTHLTDPEQNDSFTDRYFNCDLDLSKALIIFSYNDRKTIDDILLERIYEINFNQYNKDEKVMIVQQYILDKILHSAGYTNDTMIFPQNVLEYLIESYTMEAGVRDLKDKLTEIVREINLRKLYEDGGTNEISLPFTVSTTIVDDILKRKNKITITDIPKESHIGWVNGLYATAMGIGGITVIQVFDTPSDQKYHLELTGKLGDVMKESVRCAKTISWQIFKKTERARIENDWSENALHVHFPAAGTPKDGPSAGAAIATAIISYLSKLPFRNSVAMTGEIDLRGNVKIIGGLQCKIEGAQRAGVRIVLIPRENESEWLEIKESYDKIKVFAVDNISQIIRTCLIGATNDTFNYAINIDTDETVRMILSAIDNDQKNAIALPCKTSL